MSVSPGMIKLRKLSKIGLHLVPFWHKSFIVHRKFPVLNRTKSRLQQQTCDISKYFMACFTDHAVWSILLYRLLGQSISVAAISFHLRSKDSITTVYLRYLTAYLQTITGYSSSVPVRCSTKQVKMEQFTNSKHLPN